MKVWDSNIVGMEVWAVTVMNTVGDDYPPFLFYEKPERFQLEKLVRDPTLIASSDGAYDDGPGDFGSNIFLGIPEKVGIR